MRILENFILNEKRIEIHFSSIHINFFNMLSSQKTVIYTIHHACIVLNGYMDICNTKEASCQCITIIIYYGVINVAC